MRRFCVVSLLVCSIVSDGSKPITAAVPQAKSLFPRGGQVGSTIDVTVSGKLAKGDRVRCDRPGLTGEIAEDGTKATITIDETAEPGLYWLRFFNTEGAATPVPFVVGRLPELNEAEPNGIPSKAQVVTQSAVINGKLSESADTDIFSIKVPAGRTLVAAVDANWRLGSPVDPVMQLLNEDGVVLTQIDDDRGFDPQIAWPCDQETTLLIRLFGFPAAPNSTIRFANSADYVYRLSLTTGPWPDHVQPSAAQVGEEAELNVAGWNLTDDLKTLSAKPFTSATDADAKDSPGASFSH
ncbi:MAG: PPC domain-containing protein, partial [Planctomycetota bacterium]